MQMGLPQVLTTDQGSEFTNQLNDELMKKLGIDHRLTTPYYPQVCHIFCCYVDSHRFSGGHLEIGHYPNIAHQNMHYDNHYMG